MELKNRKHRIFSKREHQHGMNRLAANGGRPYIEARLWRAPNETDVSWIGDTMRGIVGRKERTASVSDAMRVSNKINQYIFKTQAARANGEESFIANCTGDGESVHDFMQRVSSSITYGRWCWLQVDRAPLAEGEVETLANKAPLKWIKWDALDVPDWCIDASGTVKWLITRSTVYINDDPRTDAVEATLYTLYELIDGKVFITEEIEGKAEVQGLRNQEIVPGLDRLPFVLVGRPSSDAWWFDDVENVQAQILNLDSMHNETLTDTVYPQLVVPESLANSLEVKLRESSVDGQKVATLVRELTLGRKIPIVESGEDKGISRFITPSGDLKMLTDECDRKRNLLFDMAGLALFNRETRQIQTAEAKRFDNMDTNSTLGNRAVILEAAEKKLVELSKVFDGSFKEWDPVYQHEFDVVDVGAFSAALQQTANMPDKTPKVRKLIAKAHVRILKEVGAGLATDEDFEAALEEIDNTDFAEMNAFPDPFKALLDRDEDDNDDPEKRKPDNDDE